MFWCQLVLVILNLIGIFRMIRHDIEGYPAKPALGFHGVVVTLAVAAILTVLHFYGGCYSQLIPR